MAQPGERESPSPGEATQSTGEGESTSTFPKYAPNDAVQSSTAKLSLRNPKTSPDTPYERFWLNANSMIDNTYILKRTPIVVEFGTPQITDDRGFTTGKRNCADQMCVPMPSRLSPTYESHFPDAGRDRANDG
jgi:hypothetical protein